MRIRHDTAYISFDTNHKAVTEQEGEELASLVASASALSFSRRI